MSFLEPCFDAWGSGDLQVLESEGEERSLFSYHMERRYRRRPGPVLRPGDPLWGFFWLVKSNLPPTLEKPDVWSWEVYMGHIASCDDELEIEVQMKSHPCSQNITVNHILVISVTSHRLRHSESLCHVLWLTQVLHLSFLVSDFIDMIWNVQGYEPKSSGIHSTFAHVHV